ncbi:hypothetical protein [Leptolyngbya sp. PCC 6406]|uniref:hypothetical protein n=1 Tax=Leptolyngbya sp. PCC 6406 TaxID=1173264 RepID=UPI0002ACF8E3|nr:hypothetical protein [Leptolyngbya sp. PCC 6406]
MRIYTNRTLAALWSYLQLAATAAILFVIVSQAVKLWGNDTNLEQIQNLIENKQTK